MNSPAIILRGVTKEFRIYQERNFNLKHSFLAWMKGKRGRYETFLALQDIDLTVLRGETLGLTGANGSGKSTLLKIIARILQPNRGSIQIKGKISSLLELGAGFHHELSGRENIYLNSSILGFNRRQIKDRIEKIIQFSGLERFIDAPVKTYSSGMYMRLGFSIAINVDPDILLIDEILAVGDEAFQNKCKEKIRQFQAQGKTIIIVTHDMTSMKALCHRALLLDRGVIVEQGEPERVAQCYHQLAGGNHQASSNNSCFQHPPDSSVKTSDLPPPEPSQEPRLPGYEHYLDQSKPRQFGDMRARIVKVTLEDANGVAKTIFKPDESMVVRIEYDLGDIRQPTFGAAIHHSLGLLVTGPNTRLDGNNTLDIPQKGEVRLLIEYLGLRDGKYFLSVAIYDKEATTPHHHIHKGYGFTVVDSCKEHRHGVVSLRHRWELPER